MEKQTNKKVTFLIIAITFFTMALIYYFIMIDFTDWKKWLPVSLFSITGLVTLGLYFKK